MIARKNFIIHTFLLVIFFISFPVSSDISNQTSLLTEGSLIFADLELSDLNIISYGKAGQDLAGSFIVKNNGPVPATDIHTEFVLINYQSGNYSPIWIGSKSTEILPPGIRGKVPFSFTIPKGMPPGEYILEATIYSNGKEIVIDDNTITSLRPLTIFEGEPWKGEYPDLSIIIDSVNPTNTSVGYPLIITYTPVNNNNNNAGSYHIGFFLSSDQKISSKDYLIRDVKSYQVYSNMSDTVSSIDIIPTEIPSGQYYLIAVTDYTGMIPETDESNNLDIYSNPILISKNYNLNSEEYANEISGLIFLKTNKYRNFNGLNSLIYDPLLSDIAYGHTSDMIERNYFSHYTPEGIDPKGRSDMAGYPTTKQMDDGSIRTGIAENIIRIAAGHIIGKSYSGFVDPATPEEIADVIMIDWINSPEHNKNLINPDIEKIGIGTKFDGEFFYATQNFF